MTFLKWDHTWDDRLIRFGFISILLVSFLGILLALHAGGMLIKSDAEGYYAHLRSFIIDGDFHYFNEYTEYCKHHFRGYANAITETGHVANKTFIGPAILWIPFFLLAHLLTIIANCFGSSLIPDGYSYLYQLIIGLSSAAYGYVGLVLIYQLLIRWFHKLWAFISVGVIFFGTSVIYYLLSEPCMSHAMSLFSVTLFLWLWLAKRDNKWASIWIGISIGMMFLVRPQNILFILVLLPFVYKSAVARDTSKLTWLIKTAGISFVTIIPQLIVWKIIYGQFVMYSYSGESFDFTQPVLFKSLFSPKHGLIQWTPIVGIALIGLIASLRHYPKWASLLLLCFGFQWYVNASWWCWWFGQSYGNRAYINCSIIFAFGLAYLLHTHRRIRLLVLLVIFLLVCGNLLIFLSYSSGWKTGDQPATYVQLISGSLRLMPEFIQKLFDLFR